MDVDVASILAILALFPEGPTHLLTTNLVFFSFTFQVSFDELLAGMKEIKLDL